MGLEWIEGPPTVGFDMNMIKRVRITETKEFEVRVDAVNVLNHPIFGNPNTNSIASAAGLLPPSALLTMLHSAVSLPRAVTEDLPLVHA